MGMYLGFTSISDENIERVLAFPPLIWKLIAPDDPEAFESDAAAHRKRGFLAKLFRGKDRESAAELVLREGEGIDEDLDKGWHGIHYLLTKTAWQGEPPLNFLILGGRELAGIEVGYGPARILTAAETQRIHLALSSVSTEWLRSRFDPADMMAKEIYPEIWDRDPAEDDTLEYCLEMFEVLKKYFSSMSEQRLGTIISIQ